MSKIELPEGLRKAMSAYVVSCLITEINHEAAVLAKIPKVEQIAFHRAPVKYWYELALYEEGPVLCLAMEILDDPKSPYAMETFLNVSSELDRALAEKLSRQKHLTIHFLDEHLDYTFSKRLRHRRQQQRELAQMIQRAIEHLETIGDVDWYASRQRFMREVDRG